MRVYVIFLRVFMQFTDDSVFDTVCYPYLNRNFDLYLRVECSCILNYVYLRVFVSVSSIKCTVWMKKLPNFALTISVLIINVFLVKLHRHRPRLLLFSLPYCESMKLFYFPSHYPSIIPVRYCQALISAQSSTKLSAEWVDVF